MAKRFLFPLLSIPGLLFALKVDCFLKKDKGIFRYYFNDGSELLEKWKGKVDFPVFENVKVEKLGNSLFVSWKISDPSIDKFLVVGDNGLFKLLKDNRLVLKGFKLPKRLEVYPLTKSGKTSLPARIELDG